MLKFSSAVNNNKLKHLIPKLLDYLSSLGNSDKPVFYSFSKLSGIACPYAKECLSMVVLTKEGKRIKDGKHTKYRCFSASQEALFPEVYNQRKHNTDIIHSRKNMEELVSVLQSSLPTNGNVFRIHIGGDFSLQREFDAWLTVATNNPTKLFYAYTKSLPFWVKRLNDIPNNFVLTASYGGHKDLLIKQYNLRAATVVDTYGMASLLQQPVDHDDSYAANPNGKHIPFCLLVHGPQKAGTYNSIASYNNRGQYGS